MSVRPEYFYLDTNYLINYLSFRYDSIAKKMSTERYARITANSVIKSLSQKIKIPFIVICETVAQLVKHEVNIGVVNLFGELEVAYLRREFLTDFLDILQNLADRDKMLELIDCVIVAFSIASPECCGLLTFDNKLIKNKAIKDIVKGHPNREFLVTSDPRIS
ncbi:MAG: hypothetical protein QXH12_06955 [Candidatus Caldarchaeum sp.]